MTTAMVISQAATRSQAAILSQAAMLAQSVEAGPSEVSLESVKRVGRLIVLTGPSGVGKGTLLKALLAKHPELNLSVSATTRSPRAGEVDGVNYYFVNRQQFDLMVSEGEFLEWAEFANNCYGTPRRGVEEQLQAGKWVILEIELEGARQVRQAFPQAYRIFILPPSIAELESRIRGRGQDSDDAIERRLARAKAEIDAANEFDATLVNDDFDGALARLEATVFAELPDEEPS